MSKNLKTLNDCEITALLNDLLTHNAPQTWLGFRVRNYAMAIFMLDAGLRVGELVQLKFGDIWLEGQAVKSLVVRATIAKNKTEREVPCTNRLRETALEMFKHIYSPKHLTLEVPAFHASYHHRAITTRQVRNIISDASQRSIGYRIHPHVLRHTFATRLMRVTNIRVVQKLLGHKNIGSTQIYTHPNNQDLSEAINKI